MKQIVACVFCIFIFAAGIGYAGGKGDSKFPGQSGGYLKKDPIVENRVNIDLQKPEIDLCRPLLSQARERTQ